MALINNTDWYHLYYLFDNDIKEDKFYGLSHVTEHALLIPTDIGLDFAAQGYTCRNHVCLYFGSKILEDLQEIDRKIMGGEVISEENVRCAKGQVIDEIWRMRDKTARFENLVSFVTENRIQKSAIGNPSEVANIQTQDIVTWFESKQQRGQIYRFLYKDAHNMIMSSPIPHKCTSQGTGRDMRDQGTDSVLYAGLPDEAKTVQIYFQIPALYSKSDLVKKVLYEFCVQRKVQESLGIEMDITDNYFDTDERYIRMSLPWNHNFSVKDIGRMLRTAINSITESEYQSYRNKFVDYISMVMSQHESNSDVMNEIKNSIIYSLPRITLADVIGISQTEIEVFPKEWITSKQIKVVAL